LFPAAFVFAFLSAALGKGRANSGVKDLLEERIVSQVLFWKDLVRENHFLKGLVLKSHHV
jgi:hypothetical protein